ncbi:MAG: FliM/FliN family flagellar motor switch protein [Gammaproteobacteria bacterium]|nr:FliM/FliN family flagellar motor switch protein [Gammaproteobacteria bacterium]
MTDPVLTDDEKDALLDGVANGEVEVQTGRGPQYASVKPFQIAARCRIVSNSFPRLQSLNTRLAGQFSKRFEQLVSAEASIRSVGIETCPFGQIGEGDTQASLVFDFSAQPLPGAALIYLDAGLVKQVVESFYGGSGNDAAENIDDVFTRGEISVAGLFCSELLQAIEPLWQPLVNAEYELGRTHRSTDVIDGFDPGENVIAARFDIEFLERSMPFQIVWPQSMLTSLLPVLEGQKRERDAAEDARWAQALKSRVKDLVVGISSRVGDARLTLGAVAEWVPGDIINIDDPGNSTVFVRDVAILEGRFGVHAGRYAVEAGNWLGSDIEHGV